MGRSRTTSRRGERDRAGGATLVVLDVVGGLVAGASRRPGRGVGASGPERRASAMAPAQALLVAGGVR